MAYRRNNRNKTVTNGKTVTDKLLYDLEHKSLKQLEDEGCWIPNWKRNGYKTRKEIQNKILQITQEIPGSYRFLGYKIECQLN